MGKYQFVPDYITVIVDKACQETGLTCVTVRAEGSYSRYVAVMTDGKQTHEYIMAYDYGLMFPESERPALLVSELRALFALEAVPEGESEPFEADIPEDTEETPKKPRKRGKSA
ncbi:MAG: hypothetical protein LCI00_16875 [Chloroflexi bacterium]|nr:hypothetical protein [Chloroflexota bacterium]